MRVNARIAYPSVFSMNGALSIYYTPKTDDGLTLHGDGGRVAFAGSECIPATRLSPSCKGRLVPSSHPQHLQFP